MIDGVNKDVKAAVEAELARAKRAFGDRYRSKHEAYGVLAEELYEVEREMDLVAYYKGDVLRGLHLNSDQVLEMALEGLRNAAIRAACEFIQVAAVCRKAYDGEGESNA